MCQLKNPVTPPGIDPGTFRPVPQRLNHCATPCPSFIPPKVQGRFIIVFSYEEHYYTFLPQISKYIYYHNILFERCKYMDLFIDYMNSRSQRTQNLIYRRRFCNRRVFSHFCLPEHMPVFFLPQRTCFLLHVIG
jgi:hypothetical protein